jgi:hypothetical protein
MTGFYDVVEGKWRQERRRGGDTGGSIVVVVASRWDLRNHGSEKPCRKSINLKCGMEYVVFLMPIDSWV